MWNYHTKVKVHWGLESTLQLETAKFDGLHFKQPHSKLSAPSLVHRHRLEGHREIYWRHLRTLSTCFCTCADNSNFAHAQYRRPINKLKTTKCCVLITIINNTKKTGHDSWVIQLVIALASSSTATCFREDSISFLQKQTPGKQNLSPLFH